MSVVLNPTHLVGNDNVPGNSYAYCIDLQGPWFLSKGAMIAYYGQIQFTALTHGLQGQLLHMVARQFSAPLHLGDYVVAEGYGKLILGGKSGNSPGPLVSFCIGKGLDRLHVPVVVVPSHLKEFS